eukprot:5685964-Pleurochrysis_carterae.AAC.1
MWLAGETADAASLLRLAALRTMGVVAGDYAGQDARGVAHFMCALAEGDDDAVEAVQAALTAAAREGEDVGGEGEAQRQTRQADRAAEAGPAC